MPNFGQLMNRTSRLVDETFDPINFRDWFNECLDDLSSALYLPTETTINRENGVYPLPDNFRNLIAVRASGNGDFYRLIDFRNTKSTGYYIQGDAIKLQGASPEAIDIYYNRYPQRFTTSETSETDIPEEHQYILVLYAAMKAMALEDEPGRYELFSREYRNAKFQLFNNIRRNKKPIAHWEVVR